MKKSPTATVVELCEEAGFKISGNYPGVVTDVEPHTENVVIACHKSMACLATFWINLYDDELKNTYEASLFCRFRPNTIKLIREKWGRNITYIAEARGLILVKVGPTKKLTDILIFVATLIQLCEDYFEEAFEPQTVAADLYPHKWDNVLDPATSEAVLAALRNDMVSKMPDSYANALK